MSTSRRPIRPNRTPVSQALASVLRRHRESLGLSQETLAGKADLSTNYVGNVERGEHEISLSALGKIASVLDKKISELLSEAGY